MAKWKVTKEQTFQNPEIKQIASESLNPPTVILATYSAKNAILSWKRFDYFATTKTKSDD